jgi:hypothetical protein
MAQGRGAKKKCAGNSISQQGVVDGRGGERDELDEMGVAWLRTKDQPWDRVLHP